MYLAALLGLSANQVRVIAPFVGGAFGPKIITGECRASFPKLAKPDDSKFGQNKYSIDGIFVSVRSMRGLPLSVVLAGETSEE